MSQQPADKKFFVSATRINEVFLPAMLYGKSYFKIVTCETFPYRGQSM